MEASEIVRVVLALTGSLGQILAAEIAKGQTSTLDTLRGIMRSPEDMARFAEAEIAAQHAKAASELRP
ncbi:MAG: hypothetical protein ABI862_07905 [Ilumatobacteraceae bacterium]